MEPKPPQTHAHSGRLPRTARSCVQAPSSSSSTSLLPHLQLHRLERIPLSTILKVAPSIPGANVSMRSPAATAKGTSSSSTNETKASKDQHGSSSAINTNKAKFVPNFVTNPYEHMALPFAPTESVSEEKKHKKNNGGAVLGNDNDWALMASQPPQPSAADHRNAQLVANPQFAMPFPREDVNWDTRTDEMTGRRMILPKRVQCGLPTTGKLLLSSSLDVLYHHSDGSRDRGGMEVMALGPPNDICELPKVHTPIHALPKHQQYHTQRQSAKVETSFGSTRYRHPTLQRPPPPLPPDPRETRWADAEANAAEERRRALAERPFPVELDKMEQSEQTPRNALTARFKRPTGKWSNQTVEAAKEKKLRLERERTASNRLPASMQFL